MTFAKAHWQILVLAVVIVVLWSTPVFYPLRLLVVYFHELSHGLAALLTGGNIVSLTLSPGEGGLATTQGGNLFLILSAGYVGSLLVGVVLFLIALHTRMDRAAVAALGLGALLIAALYMRDGFALFFCGLTGVILLLTARFTPNAINDLVLRVIGLTSMFYVPQDIISDTIFRAHLRSDARLLAEEFGGATMLWGGAWLLTSLAVTALTLRYGLGGTSNIRLGGPSLAKTPPPQP